MHKGYKQINNTNIKKQMKNKRKTMKKNLFQIKNLTRYFDDKQVFAKECREARFLSRHRLRERCPHPAVLLEQSHPGQLLPRRLSRQRRWAASGGARG